MIYINGIPSFRKPEKAVFTPDDRQERIELIDSVAVQDLGRVEAGDILTLQCLFSEANFERLQSLWINRTPVTYVDEAGRAQQFARVKIFEWENDRNFPTYILATFELWRA